MNPARVLAKDLRFHLFERSVHPELFDVLRRAEVRGPGWVADIVISGQSHVVALRTRRETVTQVVAPADACLPRIAEKATVPLGRAAYEELRRDEGAIRYAATVRVDRHTPAEYRRETARLLSANVLDRLKVFFDEEGGASTRSLEMTPFALVDFRRVGAGLEVVTVHACPHEGVVVRVDTRFHVRIATAA